MELNATLIETKVRYIPSASSEPLPSSSDDSKIKSSGHQHGTGGGGGGSASSNEQQRSSKAVMSSANNNNNSNNNAASPAAGASSSNNKDGQDNILLRLLILDAPSASNLGNYIAALQASGVKHLVRVCAQRYRSDVVELANIRCHAFPFDDGSPPPENVIGQWLALLDSEIRGVGPDGRCPLVAIHCVAGLGRAPIMAAIALVEYGMFAPMDAVGYIRERRKGAINQVQLDWLMTYKPRRDREGLLFKLCMCCPVQ